jgi:hypothetical protein
MEQVEEFSKTERREQTSIHDGALAVLDCV